MSFSDLTDPKDPATLGDRQRAFYRYKKAVAEHGKPFFPYGVYHDLIAVCGVLAVIIGLSVVWFAQANCDSWWNVSCDRVSTPHQQEQYTPDHPGKLVKDKKGELDKGTDRPLLGPLYEEKADPATTSYHPRPEWYFYFLFYLLIIFSNPNLVIMGTIGLPTIWLVVLMAWPFLDRRRERRPSRRPIAMAAMVLTAIMLLSFSYLGSQEGVDDGNAGPKGLSSEQIDLPGYALLFEDPGFWETCQSCHSLGGKGGAVGPPLDVVGTKAEYKEFDALLDKVSNGGGGMPARGGIEGMTDDQVAQVVAFLATLGVPEKAGDPQIQKAGAGDVQRVNGDVSGSDNDPGSGEAPGSGPEGATSGGDTTGDTSPTGESNN